MQSICRLNTLRVNGNKAELSAALDGVIQKCRICRKRTTWRPRDTRRTGQISARKGQKFEEDFGWQREAEIGATQHAEVTFACEARAAPREQERKPVSAHSL
jgi:hypothetical protein